MISRTLVADLVDDTEIIAHTGDCRLKAVILDIADDGDAVGFVQFWDSVTADPGTTAPYMVLPIPFYNDVGGSKRRYKYVFPGGLPFGTGLSYLPTTTHDGETVLTDEGLLVIEVHYERM
jgi:hypothetical protein